MKWTKFIQAGFSHVSHNTLQAGLLLCDMTHMTPWNFLPSKFLEEHKMNIVQNSTA